ncbi:MAG TPA: alpha/beta hydrolase [Thermoanaerobaculia bacterium]|jgi:hypothetical protein|nr:alpha/beta hydrolase [Thermoanaerobaculia bacterium]
MTRLLRALAFFFLLAPAAMAQRGAILDKVPTHPDRTARYVIYLHGRIIEDQGPRPTHEQWGVYEYRKILETLASAGTVISEQRRPGTDMDQFAEHVAGQVRTLLAAGVPPEHITVIGFSKGGGIAVRTSARVKNDKVNFVFLAACSGSADLDVHGRILSIYEASDDIGRSCAPLFARSKSPGERKEVRIETGGGHGAFYRPRQEWTAPALAWIKR